MHRCIWKKNDECYIISLFLFFILLVYIPQFFIINYAALQNY